MGMATYPDYLRFHQLALETHDVDPVYPVLRRFLELQQNEPDSEAGYWLSVAHLTWYHIGSALTAWSGGFGAERRPGEFVGQGLPLATERRGNRDPKQLLNNITGWYEAAEASGGLKAYLTDGLSQYRPRPKWEAVMERIQDVHGNGRWASYKLAEILMKVNGLDLEPYHMGHANSSGPRRGLELLIDDLPQGDGAADVAALDQFSQQLVEGIRARGLPAPVEEVETTLCDFHALHEGRYYVGNDIDQMLEQLHAVPAGSWLDDALQARFDTLPEPYLGEQNGWTKVDRDRQKAYKLRGEILTR